MYCEACGYQAILGDDLDGNSNPWLTVLATRRCGHCGVAGRPSAAAWWGVLALIGALPVAIWIGSLLFGGRPRWNWEMCVVFGVAFALTYPLARAVHRTSRFVPDAPPGSRDREGAR